MSKIQSIEEGSFEKGYNTPDVFTVALDDGDLGTLQFTAYNEHNGYYSHEAVYIYNGVVTSERL